MYKITLFDENCVSFVSGTVSFFTDELEEFERSWLGNPHVSDDKKMRYLRSKNGECVTDYYSDSEELNIVQQDENAVILNEKEFVLDKKEFLLHNAFGCKVVVYAEKAYIKYKIIRFKDEEYLIGRYRLEGVCDVEEDRITDVSCYGNPVINLVKPSDATALNEKGRYRQDRTKEEFRNDMAETFVWILVYRRYSKKEIPFDDNFLLSDEILAELMTDIPGEAG